MRPGVDPIGPTVSFPIVLLCIKEAFRPSILMSFRPTAHAKLMAVGRASVNLDLSTAARPLLMVRISLSLTSFPSCKPYNNYKLYHLDNQYRLIDSIEFCPEMASPSANYGRVLTGTNLTPATLLLSLNIIATTGSGFKYRSQIYIFIKLLYDT